MKRKICSIIIALMAIIAVVFAFAACGEDNDAVTKYTVTYSAGEGGGTAPNGGEYAEGETFTLPAATGLSREGYDFDKWNDGTTDYAVGATYTMPAKNVTFTAKWVESVVKYTVTYLAGENAEGDAPDGGEYAAGETFTLPAATGLSREGYDFDKWNDGTTDYAVGATYTMPAKNVTFTAKWVESVVKYTVTYLAGENAEGDAPDGGEYAAGETFTLPEATGLVSTEGNIFAKWNDGTADYAAGATYTMPAENVTFTAVWAVPHTVTYKGSFLVEATSVPAAKQYAEGATVTLPENEMTLLTDYQNYIFTGWKTGTKTYQPGDTFVMPANNVEITAQWVEGKKITFDLDGGTGTVPETKLYAKNSVVTLPTSKGLNKPGHTLAGWRLGSGDDATNYALGASYTVGNYDVTFTAIWETSQTPTPDFTLDDIVGQWTATGYSLDIIKHGSDDNPYIVGYGILDGKYFVQVIESEGELFILSLDWDVYYALTLNGTSLVLTPESGEAIELTEQSTLTSANRSMFIGKWAKHSTDYDQPWVIAEDSVAYGINMLAANSIIVGNRIALWYEAAGYPYYVLEKNSYNLVGYYDASGVAPTEATFIPGDYLVLYVDGVPNQTVNSGATPNAGKITTPEAPEEGKVFDKWVLAGTETEFDLTTAMTTDVSIEATWKEGEDGTTYVGRCVRSGYTIIKIVLNDAHNKLTYTLDNGTEKTVNLTGESYKPTTNKYDDSASYYSLKIENINHYVLVKADGTEIWLYDNGDNPLAKFSVPGSGGSTYDFVTVDITTMFGKKFISADPIIGSYVCIEIANQNNFGYNIKLKSSANTALGRSFYPSSKDLTPRTTFAGNNSQYSQDITIGFIQKDGNYILVVTSLLENNVEQLSEPIELTEVS